MLLTPRIVRGHDLTQDDISPIHIGTQTHFGLTGPPALIAPQPDAGVPDTTEPDAPDAADAGAVVETVPDAPDADPVPPEPSPPGEPALDRAPAPVEPEPVLPPPSAQPELLPASPDVVAAAQVLVTPPGTQFRVGGGPYTVTVSIAGVSQPDDHLADAVLRPERPAGPRGAGGELPATGRRAGHVHAAGGHGRRADRHHCSAPGFLDSGLTVFASMLPRPARRSHVAPERGFDSGTSLASTARCTSA